MTDNNQQNCIIIDIHITSYSSKTGFIFRYSVIDDVVLCLSKETKFEAFDKTDHVDGELSKISI